MQTENRGLVAAFIEAIWNEGAFDRLAEFIHPAFYDHSLPQGFSPDAAGLQQWIRNTGAAFAHRTVIEDQVTEGAKSVVKIRMCLTHIGPWRGLAPTGKSVEAVGYRLFRIGDGRIIEHWALIDGQGLEHAIREAAHGCKIAD